MQTKFSRVINFLYGPYFKVVGFFYRIFSTNRARVERLKANQTFSAILKGFTVLVLVGWILIWLFASDHDRTRLHFTVEIERHSPGDDNGKNQQCPEQPLFPR